MLKALMKLRLRAFLAYFSGATRTKKPSKAKTVLFTLLMLYCVAVFCVMFFGLFFSLAEAFLQTDFAWLFFAMFLLICFALMFLGSLFMTKSQLYEAKDNELLMALPIPAGTILLSRLLSLFLYNLIFELLTAVPFLLVWAMHSPLSAAGVVLYLLVVTALNLLSLALTSAFSWVLARITAKLRNKTLVTTVFSVLFLAAYFYGISKANAIISSIARNGERIASSLGAFAPLRTLGEAMARQDIAAALLPVFAMLLFAAAVYLLLARSFLQIVTAKSGAAKVVYREKALKVSSANAALLRRETARLLSSSGYILNAGLGAIFCLAAAVILPFAKDRLLAALSQMPLSDGALQLVVIGAICMLQSTITFTACSVSLEGDTLWIVRSLPVSSQQILNAKLQLHTRIAAVCALCLGLSAGLTLRLNLPLTVLIPVFYAALCAKIGLVENLRHPFFAWTNEMQAVKQGISVLFALLLSFAAVIVPAGLYYLVRRFGVTDDTFLCGVLLLYALLNVLLGKWIQTKGSAVFEGLC